MFIRCNSRNAVTRSRSDTEVVAACLLEKGADAFETFNGMWALAFFLEREKKLIFSRDRLGKKPLYIYEADGILAFASELKVFSSLGLKLTLNQSALHFYNWLGYIPGEMSIYEECRKIKAGTVEVWDLSADKPQMETQRLYWDPLKAFSRSFAGSYDDAIDSFLETLDDAVGLRLHADVPVGLFLSGGIDSSLVSASLARQRSNNIVAYTVSHFDKDFDESKHAQATARQLGIPLHVLELGPQDFQRQLDRIAYHFDEPFSDSSQIATMAISEKARENVAVILTGDGGDESFFGYPRYLLPQNTLRLKRALACIPGFQKLLAKMLYSSLGRFALKSGAPLFGFSPAHLDYKVDRLSSLMLAAPQVDSLYDVIMSVQPRSHNIPNCSLFDFYRATYPEYSWDSLLERPLCERFAALDLISYLRDDVLVKVDRSTMAYGLEARSPLLDYRIVEFGASLPLAYKYNGGRFKAILRDALSRRVHGEVLKLPKRGFGVPLPENLPQARNAFASWNIFVENAWKQSFAGKYSSVDSL